MTFKAIKGIKCLLTEKKDKPVSSDYEKLSKGNVPVLASSASGSKARTQP